MILGFILLFAAPLAFALYVAGRTTRQTVRAFHGALARGAGTDARQDAYERTRLVCDNRHSWTSPTPAGLVRPTCRLCTLPGHRGQALSSIHETPQCPALVLALARPLYRALPSWLRAAL